MATSLSARSTGRPSTCAPGRSRHSPRSSRSTPSRCAWSATRSRSTRRRAEPGRVRRHRQVQFLRQQRCTRKQGEQARMATITPEAVYEPTKEGIDPELGVNIVDLGLVYGVDVDEQTNAEVTM